MAVARTAVRPVDGELAGWNPVELAGVVGREALERARLSAEDLDEVVVGCADPVGACGADAARAIVLAAGWPVGVGGLVVDRGETSGMAAVQAATASIRAGQARTVLVVGLGLCSVVPPGAAALNRTYGAPWGGVAERFAEAGGLLPAPRLSERAAEAAGMGRAELDAAAEESRRRRAEAGEESRTRVQAAEESRQRRVEATEESRQRSEAAEESGQRRVEAAEESRQRRVEAAEESRQRVQAAVSRAVVAVAARPGDAAARGVYPGDPVAADVLRDWGDSAELPPAFDDEGLLTAATFAPPADAVAAVLLQAPGDRDGPQSESFDAPPAGATTASTGASTAETVTPSRSDRGSGEAWGRGAALATVVGMGRAAGDPFDPIGGVTVAVGRALAETGTELDAVDDIAVVEQDAATVGLVARALGVAVGRINRAGGAVATGNAAAAEELRLITDGLAGSGAGRLLLTISAGPTGSAAIVWYKHI